MAELEEIEKQKKKLQGDITDMASYQVSLSKDIERIKPILEGLTDQRNHLLREINDLEVGIEKRKAERDESLNQRDVQITKKETQLNVLSEELHNMAGAQIARQQAMDFQTEQNSIISRDNAALKDELNALEKQLRDKEKVLDLVRDEIRKEREETSGLLIEARDARFLLDQEIKTQKQIALKNQAEAERLRQKEKNLIEDEAHVKQRDRKLDQVAGNLDRLTEEHNVRVKKAEEQERINGLTLQRIEDESKILEHGWAKINKLNRDRQLNADIEAMKKG